MNWTFSSGDHNSSGSQGPVSQGSAGPGQPWSEGAAPYPASGSAPHGYAPTQYRQTQGSWPDNGPYPQTWAAPPNPGPRQKPKKTKRIKVIAGAAISFVVLLMGMGAWIIVDASRMSFEAIGQKCDNEYSLGLLMTLTGFKEAADNTDAQYQEVWDSVPSFVTVNRDGSSIIVDDRDFYSVDKIDFLSGTRGAARDEMEELLDLWNGARDLSIMSAVDCIHEELDMPESVNTRMLSTRGMDGVQEVAHDGARVTWSYHPSRGLNAIYEME